MGVLSGRSIVLGVSGGIAAYKAAALASLLVQSGAHVETVLTESAMRFIQPLTFSAITHAPVHTDVFTPWAEDFSGHVILADQADLLIIAPATTATIARLALGLVDDLLQLVALSTQAPILIAPAMEQHMYRHPALQAHLATLATRGATLVGPDRGRLASGAEGEGRLASPESIVEAACWLLGRGGPLAGSKVVVSAGGTREPIDPVRYVGNRSSGTMGYAIARAARDAGADVTLVSGPVPLTPPAHIEFVAVETASEMKQAIDAATETADLLIMAAAVADFRPAQVSKSKIKKEHGQETLDLKFFRTADILASLDRPRLVTIGFAAETDDLLENAQKKFTAKNLDAIVANDAVATIGAQTSQATILTRGEHPRSLPAMPKSQLAAEIVKLGAHLLASRSDTA